MHDIETLKDYFKKLQKVLTYESEFTFFTSKLIKKNKIDDILCCIIPTLPEKYKKIMKMKEGKKLGSVLCYDLLFNCIKKKFILNPDMYLVDYEKAVNYINSILKTIEKDIQYAEKFID